MALSQPLNQKDHSQTCEAVLIKQSFSDPALAPPSFFEARDGRSSTRDVSGRGGGQLLHVRLTRSAYAARAAHRAQYRQPAQPAATRDTHTLASLLVAQESPVKKRVPTLE